MITELAKFVHAATPVLRKRVLELAPRCGIRAADPAVRQEFLTLRTLIAYGAAHIIDEQEVGTQMRFAFPKEWLEEERDPDVEGGRRIVHHKSQRNGSVAVSVVVSFPGP